MTSSARSAVTSLAAVVMVLAYVVMMIAVVGGKPVWFVVAAALSYAADAVLVDSDVSAALSRWSVDLTFRFMLRELLLVAIFVAHARPSVPAVVCLLVGLAGVHVIRLCYLYLFMRARRTRRGLIRWANLDVDGERASPVPLALVGPSWPPLRGVRLPLYFDLVLFVAAALAWRRHGWPLAVAVVLIAAAGAALVRAGLLQYLHERAKPRVEKRNARLRAVLAERAPEIVVYFSSAVTSTYALNVWLETIDRLHRSSVIFVRETGHMANLGPTATPVIVLPTATSVERFRLSTMRVALYPTTVIKNNHMLRLTRIRHIFINHGDGDKSVTYSPLHRAFDEVWVAGPAARDRYLNNHVGVRDEQIRLVGRPQLAHIRRAVDRPAGVPPGPFTVLYAPTWEGNFDLVDYSSVTAMGEAIVRALLASPLPITVLFKPHPATGQRSRAARAARARLQHMVTEAGAPHQVIDLGPAALYDAFNASDLLIADVSSVVADYLASRKPYIVTNPKGLDTEQTRIDLPSTSGGHLLGPDLSGFAEMLTDALGPDALRERRRELAAYFLGAEVEDPIEHFVQFTDTAVDQESARLLASAVGVRSSPDQAGLHEALPDEPRLDEPRPDETDPDEPRPDEPRPGNARFEDTRPDDDGAEELAGEISSDVAAVSPVRTRSAIVLLLIMESYVLATVSALAAWPWVFAAATAAGFVLDLYLRQCLDGLFRLLAAAQAGIVLRFLARDVLLLVFLARSDAITDVQFGRVVATLLVLYALRVFGVVVRDDIRRRRFMPVAWRNFDVDGVHRAKLRTPGWASDVTWLGLLLTAPVYAGAVSRCVGAAPGVLSAGLVIALILTAALDVLYLSDWLRSGRDTPLPIVLEHLGEALRELAPEVVFYFSRPDAPRYSSYIVNVWVPTFERLERPVLIVLRERHQLRSPATETLPIVLITRAGDLETLIPESVRLAFYPSNVMKNNHLIRLPGITDVFIGHGDSDKGGSATTLTRIFDETWVSGRAGRDRYHLAEVGVRDEQIREVGRPQLTEIELAEPHELLQRAKASDHRLTVLYAPTREGFYADWNYSSVLTMGATILTTLMNMDGVRVVFRPHPGTGTDDLAFRAEVRALHELVASRGAPHVNAVDDSLYSAFNEADVLVSDISSVITDFLASGKPYIVTDPNGEDPNVFKAKFPSSAGAYLLGPTCAGLREMVEQALGADPMAEQRIAVAQYLLGDITANPFLRFAKAVDLLLAPGLDLLAGNVTVDR